jgi:hypothetical protein
MAEQIYPGICKVSVTTALSPFPSPSAQPSSCALRYHLGYAPLFTPRTCLAALPHTQSVLNVLLLFSSATRSYDTEIYLKTTNYAMKRQRGIVLPTQLFPFVLPDSELTHALRGRMYFLGHIPFTVRQISKVDQGKPFSIKFQLGLPVTSPLASWITDGRFCRSTSTLSLVRCRGEASWQIEGPVNGMG